MAERGPRHRRRNPGAVALYVLIATAFVLVAGSLWAVVTLFGSDDSPSEPASFESGEPEGPRSATPGEPDGEVAARYRISIPSVDVMAPVVEVDSNDERVLHPPEDPMLAGWWRAGAAVGDAAGAVLVIGHAAEEADAVFNEVGTLGEGDMVLLGDDVLHTYRVSSVDELAPEELAARAGELFAADGPARLVLVTCDDWDGGEFRTNVVVTADPVSG